MECRFKQLTVIDQVRSQMTICLRDNDINTKGTKIRNL